jgi:hypothetical protein
MNNLYGAHFFQYMRKDRDESTMRSSAARSYVGSGAISKGKGKGNSSSSSAPASSQTSQGDVVEKGVTVKYEGKDESVPVCPPVFEGDYWVNECLRVHRSVISRSRGDDGTERDVNKRKARDLLKHIMSMQNGSVFSKPVDAIALGIPEYLTVVQRPMDLGTVREKLRKDGYTNMLTLVEVRSSLLLSFSPSLFLLAFSFA